MRPCWDYSPPLSSPQSLRLGLGRTISAHRALFLPRTGGRRSQCEQSLSKLVANGESVEMSEEDKYRRRKSLSARFWAPLGIALEAHRHFIASDGWALASHIALSTLISLFPFLIVLTGVGSLVGSEYLAEQPGAVLLHAWPQAVAKPIPQRCKESRQRRRAGRSPAD
jgi:hypothetical protein